MIIRGSLNNNSFYLSISIGVARNCEDSSLQNNLLSKAEYALRIAKKQNISNRLGLEIVESEDLITCKDAKDNLLMLKNLGYSLFIDDFGSGYSNFIYLTEIKRE